MLNQPMIIGSSNQQVKVYAVQYETESLDLKLEMPKSNYELRSIHGKMCK